MAGSLSMPKNPYHVRSTSLPSRSHPLALRVEDQLQKLRTSEALASSSTSSRTRGMLCQGLDDLANLYGCVEELLQSSLTQQALMGSEQKKWVDEMLDGSLRVLDLCEITKDVFKLMLGNVQDLLSALRRRRVDNSGLRNQVRDYIPLRKKMHKETDNRLKSLKKMESKVAFSPLSDKDQHLVLVIGMLREVRAITMSIFESLLSFSSSQLVAEMARRSLISKWRLGSGRVACEEDIEKMSNIEQVDAYLCFLYCNKSCQDIQTYWAQNLEKRIRSMDLDLQSVENGLDCLFRRLIKSRVPLLNIFSH